MHAGRQAGKHRAQGHTGLLRCGTAMYQRSQGKSLGMCAWNAICETSDSV